MPFDGTPTPTQNLDTLIKALRSPMPKGFEWFYGSYDSCACALARRLGIVRERVFHSSEMAGPLGLTEEQAALAMSGVAYGGALNAHNVTPQMVTDRLEQIRTPRSAACQEVPHGSAVAIVAQFGDFPIEQEVVARVAASEHLV